MAKDNIKINLHHHKTYYRNNTRPQKHTRSVSTSLVPIES